MCVDGQGVTVALTAHDEAATSRGGVSSVGLVVTLGE